MKMIQWTWLESNHLKKTKWNPFFSFSFSCFTKNIEKSWYKWTQWRDQLIILIGSNSLIIMHSIKDPLTIYIYIYIYMGQEEPPTFRLFLQSLWHYWVSRTDEHPNAIQSTVDITSIPNTPIKPALCCDFI